MSRWVKLDSAIIDSPVWTDPLVLKAFLAMLLEAHYRKDPTFVNGTPIYRGQMLSSYGDLMEVCGIGSRRTMKNVLDFLVKNETIVYHSRGCKGILIHVINYGKYQFGEDGNCTDSVQISEQIGVQFGEQIRQNLPIIKTERKEGTDYECDFLAFWNLYPPKRRNAKDKAFQEYCSLRNDGVGADSIVKVLEDWMVSKDWTSENGRFIPAAYKWLNSLAPSDFKEFEGKEEDEEWVTI